MCICKVPIFLAFLGNRSVGELVPDGGDVSEWSVNLWVRLVVPVQLVLLAAEC